MPPRERERSNRRGSSTDKVPASPTGGKDSPGKEKSNSARDKEAKPTKRRTSFGGTSRREMRLDLLGENTPGPGSYQPSSTFARAASSSSFYRNKKLATTTAQFRSNSAQRGAVRNEKLPGPGTFSPNMNATERNATNSGPHLRAKGSRFAPLEGSDATASTHKPEPGPGAYESHYPEKREGHPKWRGFLPSQYQTMAMDSLHAMNMGSKQNPGFGIASSQHQLPHETVVQAEAQFPGPGKYETNKSDMSKADGHRSVFKPPTERKKMNDQVRIPKTDPARKARRARAKAGGDTVHV